MCHRGLAVPDMRHGPSRTNSTSLRQVLKPLEAPHLIGSGIESDVAALLGVGQFCQILKSFVVKSEAARLPASRALWRGGGKLPQDGSRRGKYDRCD
jgi:hypothetical protein